MKFEAGASPAKRRQARRAADAAFDSTLGLPHAQVVGVDGDVQAAVRQLRRQPGVTYAQPNYIYTAAAVETPDDTFFGQLWGLSDPALPDTGVGALDAWEVGKEGEGQVIAILDTGVDLTHPDLVGNLWENPSAGAEDEHGYDFVDDDPDPDDYNFHGTHVAGTAAATSNNAQGIAGVAPKAQIMAVRVLDGDGSGSTDDIAAGIDYAADNGAAVLNMSLGGPSGGGDKAMEDAIDRAGEADAVVVVAAGNEGVDNDAEPHTPCALPNSNMICVAALSQSTGTLAGFSNYGKDSVDIAAPGTSILSSKAHYGEPVFADDFESGLDLWTRDQANGGEEWGESSPGSGGFGTAAADSPAGDYGGPVDPEEFAESEMFTTTPVNLSAEHGCRLHFKTRYEIEPAPAEGFFDLFVAGAVGEGSGAALTGFSGTSSGYSKGLFGNEDLSISELDGRPDVLPIFGILADELLEFDGAFVDNVRLLCRAETGYLDQIASGNYEKFDAGDYVRFDGTSMATPHVAGVVALVRAAAPGLNAGEVIDAVLKGASAIPNVTSGKRTATEGIADACKAIAAATEGDVGSECPASSEPEPQPDLETGGGEPPSAELPIPPPDPAPAPSPEARIDRTAPRTGFRRKPPKLLLTPWRWGRAVFRFRSNEAGVVYLCQFDRKRYRKCGARFVRWFLRGRHVLRVRARDAAGNVDRTPAVYRFRVRGISTRKARRNPNHIRQQAGKGVY